jgi:hypothetical protein
MSQLLELAERCEQATRPDRELDGAIALALGWTFQKMKGDALQKMKGDAQAYWREPGVTDFYMRSKLPAYTASIDAAMTLVPKGKYWTCSYGRLSTHEVMGAARIVEPLTIDFIAESEAATPALALCAASLRARATP